MKKYSALFRKEIKNMYRELLIVLTLQIGYLVYEFIIFNHIDLVLWRPSPFERFMHELFNMSYFLYPVLLIYSLYLEERTGTLYQAHSLPLKRMLLITKFFVVLCALVIAAVVITVCALIASCIISRSASPDVVFRGIYGLLRFPFVSLCLVCTAWGFMQLVRQNRLVVGLAAGTVGFGVYIWLRVFIKVYIDWFAFNSLIYHVKYTLVMGAIFSLIGFFFYERYSEC